MPETDNSLVQAMLDPAFYNHPVEQLRLIETHISWVFLTGPYAYKVKKPINLGFLDFTRLEKRQFYCEEELRLNRRLAADIYLDVIPITKAHETFYLGNIDADAVDKQAEVVDYAVRMKQFDQDCLLERQLEKRQVSFHHVQQLADRLAEFHANIAVADDSMPHGNSDQVIKPIEQNFSILKSILSDETDLEKLQRIELASVDIFTAITGTLKKRKQQGFIRECHGDMHLGNIALVDDNILIFDGIEFNDSFKWIDTMSELAFLVMDLEDHGEQAYANRLLNRYLQITGDYEGLKVFRFYLLYRAMVRAKVAAIRVQQEQKNRQNSQHEWQDLRNYLDLALHYIETDRNFIAIGHGVSGTGKSWISQRLAQHCGGVLIRSDSERKRLYANHEDLYTDDITQHTYQRLFDLCTDISKAGFPVFVDATFLDIHWRRKFRTLARGLGKPFYILACHADVSTLKERIRQRARHRDNISDADIDVLEKQMQNYQPPGDEEAAYIIEIDTEKNIDIAALAERLGATGTKTGKEL